MLDGRKRAACAILAIWGTLMLATRSAAAVRGALGALDGSSESLVKNSVAGPKQPLPFSHKAHLAIGLSCEFCHASKLLDGPNALPSVERCMSCHRTIDRDKPSIRALASFAHDHRSIPWVRVYSIPGWVYWSHAPHLNAGVKCADCHGDVSEMDVLYEAKNVTTMKGCTACHQQLHVLTDCHACHEVSSN